MERRLMVVGARPESVGMHVASAASDRNWIVSTAGIQDEDIELNVFNPSQVRSAIRDEMPHSIVCTVGINSGPQSIRKLSWDRSITEQIEINYVGPLRILREWVRAWLASPLLEEAGWNLPMHFVAISSNSAQVARSQSAGYCASKAALSMALRCVARDLAAEYPFSIYDYEPGWIDGTPMSTQAKARWDNQFAGPVVPDTPMHRIPGERVVNPVSLAALIIGNIQVDRRYLNGCTLRIDGGEQ